MKLLLSEQQMKLLLSEQQERTEKAIKEFNSTGQLTIYEPCDCGSQVRHNNGGNYHDIVRLARNGDKTFIMADTTSELEAPAEWQETNEAVENVVAAYANWL